MGLVKQILIDDRSRIGIWKIPESKTSLRQQQRLASRMLIKELLNASTEPEITYNRYGKPFLCGYDGFISISHSDDLVAVYISSAVESGIDIQRIKPKINRIAPKFAGKEELRLLANDSADNQLHKLHLIWCAKESIYKLYGKGNLNFKENIFTGPIVFSEKGRFDARLSIDGQIIYYESHYEKFENFILVHTFAV